MRPFSMLRWSPLALLFVCLPFAACESREDYWTDELRMEGPILAGDRLAWLNSTTGSVISLRPGSRAQPSCHPTLEHARALTSAGDSLVLLGNSGARTFLQKLSLAGGGSNRIQLRADFDRLSVAPDGRAAIAFHDLGATQRPGGPVARNLNEVAIIDLQGAAATQLNLQTGAAAPTEVHFSADGELAAILFERALALLNVRDPADVVLVPLKLPGGQPLQILEALLDPGGELLFLRTAELDEVLAISIERSGDRIAASINFLGPGAATELKDIALPGEGFDRRIVALYQDRATLYDADGDTFRDVSVFFSGSPSRISLLSDGVVLLHGDPSERAASTFVAAWDLSSGRITQDRLEGPLVGAPIVSGAAAFFPHGVDGHPTMSAATIERQELRLRLRLQPIGLSGFPTALTSYEEARTLFASVEIPRERSGAAPVRDDDFSGYTAAILSLQADDLTIDGLTLDDEVVELGMIGAYLYALHPSKLGDLTLIPTDKLERSAAHRYESLFTTGLIGCE